MGEEVIQLGNCDAHNFVEHTAKMLLGWEDPFTEEGGGWSHTSGWNIKMTIESTIDQSNPKRREFLEF